MVHVGSCTPESINYVCKYLVDNDNNPTEDQRPFAMMSKGLGAVYLEENFKWHKEGLRPYAYNGNSKLSLPRYYKERIFDEHDKTLIGLKANELESNRLFEEMDRLDAMGS